MRSYLVALAIPLSLVACKKGETKPRKLKKMDFKVTVDEKGRMLPSIELFDDKHSPIVFEGSYTMTILRPDGTVLCSHTRTLAKTDYTEKKTLKSFDYQDAACPPDPAAEELRITLEVKAGDKPDDIKLSRDKTTPTKIVYRHLGKPPAAGAGSAGSAAAGSGSAAPAVDPKKLPAEAPLPEPPPGPTPPASGSGSADAKAVDTATGSAK